MAITELMEDPKTALKGICAAVVVFYAPWCRDCKVSEEFEGKLADDFAGKADFFRLDSVNLEEIADAYEVERYPTWMFFIKGKPMPHPLVEPMTEGEARNWLEMRLAGQGRRERK
ncbi:protein disulfide isomerase family protein [Candidatus Micrarchaeota archaeon]|nr:protein disulfide isomerase family protein [Candidatus Micrarchaeota archaeon]